MYKAVQLAVRTLPTQKQSLPGRTQLVGKEDSFLTYTTTERIRADETNVCLLHGELTHSLLRQRGLCLAYSTAIYQLWKTSPDSALTLLSSVLLQLPASLIYEHLLLALRVSWSRYLPLEKHTLGVSVRGPSSETILIAPTYVTQIKDNIGSLYLYSESSQLLLPMSTSVSYGNIKCIVSLLVICAHQ